jgi:hypothetical protein
MRKSLHLLLAGAIALSPLTAASAPKFEPYEGKKSVVDGEGGTRVQNAGIDFWTSGTPPHRYRILGVLTDARPSGGFGSDLTKSQALAKRIKDVGGDAAIVLGEETKTTGAVSLGNGLTALAQERTTRLMVVHYEDQQAAKDN